MAILTYSSFENCLKATTSSFKKRLILTEEDSTKSRKRLCFAKFEDEEYRYYEKVEQLTEMMKKFIFTKLLVTKIPKKKKGLKLKMKKMKAPEQPMVIITNEVTELLKRFNDEIYGGSDLKLLIQKRLNHIDLETCKNRLIIPINQMQNSEFLNPGEKILLDKKSGGTEVRFMGPKLQMYNKKMVFKVLKCNHTISYYVFTNNWNQFVKDYMNDLRENTKIQVWSFRKNQELCFDVVVVGNEENDVA